MGNEKAVEMINFGDVLEQLWRRRRTLAVIVVVGCVLTLAATFLIRPTYRAAATIVPASSLDGRGGGALAALQGAAGGMGLNLGGGGDDLSDLFPRILRSRTVLERVLRREFRLRDGGADTLMAWIDPSGSTPESRLDSALRKLRSKVNPGVDSRTGAVTVAVTLTDPVLAAAVSNAVVEELDIFIRSVRNAHSGSQAVFIGERLEEISLQLKESEEALLDFRRRNRIISGSPQLMLEEGRLIREVEVNQRLFLELKAQRELAGIERYRDVPLVIVLDEAATPVTRFAPRRARLLVSGFVVFFLCGSLWILAGESRRSRAVPTGKDT